MSDQTQARAATDGVGDAAAESTHRILLVDRASALRVELAQLITLEADFTIVGQAGTIDEAEHMASDLAPDLIIVEPDLPDAASGDAIPRLRAAWPRARIVVHSHLDSARSIRGALRTGASGYIVKYGLPEDFVPNLRAVLKGERHLCAVAAKRLRRVSRAESDGQAKAARGITRREREVLTMIATGLCNKRIASALHLSVKTIEKHRANLMRKLQLRNVAGLTRFALQNGFVKFTSGNGSEMSETRAIQKTARNSVRWSSARNPGAPVAACAAEERQCPHLYYLDRRACVGTDRRARSDRRTIPNPLSLGSEPPYRRTEFSGRRARDHLQLPGVRTK